MPWGGGGICSLKTVNMLKKLYVIILIQFLEDACKLNLYNMMYIDISRRNYLLVNVEVPRPAPKASGHEVADRLVGSLFHARSVAGKRNGTVIHVTLHAT